MASFHEHRRRAILPFIGVLMAAYYSLVFLPLSRKAQALDKPLDTAWRQLAGSLGRTNSMHLDLQRISSEVEETKQALAALAAAEQRTIARLHPGDGLRARLSAPFRLVDYQNELSRHADEISQRAHLRKIKIAPGVYDGYPQHRVDTTEPALLWAALRMTEDLLDTAVLCGVTGIESLEVPASFTNAPSGDLARWVQVPLTIEFSGPAPAATQVLKSLGLRHEELKPAGLPETSREKSVLFIDRLVIKRQAPEQEDRVRVWLRAVGFVLRE